MKWKNRNCAPFLRFLSWPSFILLLFSSWVDFCYKRPQYQILVQWQELSFTTWQIVLFWAWQVFLRSDLKELLRVSSVSTERWARSQHQLQHHHHHYNHNHRHQHHHHHHHHQQQHHPKTLLSGTQKENWSKCGTLVTFLGSQKCVPWHFHNIKSFVFSGNLQLKVTDAFQEPQTCNAYIRVWYFRLKSKYQIMQTTQKTRVSHFAVLAEQISSHSRFGSYVLSAPRSWPNSFHFDQYNIREEVKNFKMSTQLHFNGNIQYEHNYWLFGGNFQNLNVNAIWRSEI